MDNWVESLPLRVWSWLAAHSHVPCLHVEFDPVFRVVNIRFPMETAGHGVLGEIRRHVTAFEGTAFEHTMNQTKGEIEKWAS